MSHWKTSIVVLAACAAPSAPLIENRVQTPSAAPPHGACPRLSPLDSDAWQSIAFPQCPGEPFETDLPICASRDCPKPCRVTKSYPDIPSTSFEIRYDDAGRWLSSSPTAPRTDSTELRRAATYSGDHMQSCRNSNSNVDYTNNMSYERDRLVGISNGRDADIHLVYDATHPISIAEGDRPRRIEYDASGRVVAITDGEDTTTYRYDATGQLAELDHHTLQPLEHSRFSYDARRRLVRVDSILQGGDASASKVAITYDGSGRVTQIVDDVTVDHDYRYATAYSYCD